MIIWVFALNIINESRDTKIKKKKKKKEKKRKIFLANFDCN